ncbi:hypothetical protein [Deinococcus budaensis]|uniref:Putative flippase GtrA n=1 Tax=Deinococcus budaensis TaxID=1665626 RepID=A0A7W8LS45_9DEIO|nr:hypothetical protein [Deinococcus budaensis]MBB5236300.1 putative flippase GtrA [Deinococcus budaensis]
MTEIHLKLTFGILATIVTLVFLWVAYLLAINGQAEAAAFTAIGGPIVGGGLFRLFERMSR